MPDTITKSNVEARVWNVNRRMESRGSIIRYAVESHSGHTHLYREHIDGYVIDHITAGTKREVADFLHAMMTALDDSARTDD